MSSLKKLSTATLTEKLAFISFSVFIPVFVFINVSRCCVLYFRVALVFRHLFWVALSSIAACCLTLQSNGEDATVAKFSGLQLQLRQKGQDRKQAFREEVRSKGEEG